MARAPAAGLAEARELVASIPQLETGNLTEPDLQRWIGRASALVDEFGTLPDKVAFDISVQFLTSSREVSGHKMRALLNKTLARIEQEAEGQRGAALINAGDVFAGFVSITDTIRRAARVVWIVDPFMDDTVLRDYGPLVPERVSLRLLTRNTSQNEAIVPATQKWRRSYGPQRHLEARLAPRHMLHDRFIAIDGKEVWLLSQSLRDFAERSPATVVLFEECLTQHKLEAYEAIWQQSQVIE